MLKLKNNKAPGEDSIIAELIENIGHNILEELTKIITEIWQSEKFPDDWKNALIHPLHKKHKKGDKTELNNYRGIFLLQVGYKILSSCLLKRVQEQLEHKIGEYQAGFRPGGHVQNKYSIWKPHLNIEHQEVNQPSVCLWTLRRHTTRWIDVLSSMSWRSWVWTPRHAALLRKPSIKPPLRSNSWGKSLWIEEVDKDLEKAGISSSEILDRNTFRRKIEQWKVQPGREIKKKVGTKWFEERKRAYEEKWKYSGKTRIVRIGDNIIMKFLWINCNRLRKRAKLSKLVS